MCDIFQLDKSMGRSLLENMADTASRGILRDTFGLGNSLGTVYGDIPKGIFLLGNRQDKV